MEGGIVKAFANDDEGDAIMKELLEEECDDEDVQNGGFRAGRVANIDQRHASFQTRNTEEAVAVVDGVGW